MNPSDLLPGALLGSGPLSSKESKVFIDKPEEWKRWGVPLGLPHSSIQAFRKAFGGGADCPTESYCSFRSTTLKPKPPSLETLQRMVAKWEAFAAAPKHPTLPKGWFEAALASVKGPDQGHPKTLLAAIQGYLVSQGALLLPWEAIVKSYGSHGSTAMTNRLMTLCGAEAVNDATTDGDFAFAHHSTFLYPGAKERVMKFKVDGPYGAWGVVLLKPASKPVKRLLGYITIAIENAASLEANFDHSYSYGIKAREADPKAMPWSLKGSVWSRVLDGDPSRSKTKGYSKSALYVEHLCASKSSVKNVGKLLLLWAFAWFHSASVPSTFLELGFLGPALEPGMVTRLEEGEDDFICAQIPSTYAASVYHQVFKYQRVFSLAPPAMDAMKAYVENCVTSICYLIVKDWTKIKSVGQRRQILAIVKERYLKALESNLAVFKPDFPAPYAHDFREKPDPKFGKDREAMVGQGSLAPRYKEIDLVKEPHRFMRYFMYRPYPTEDHLRSIFLSIV